jgi:hypothetical protein
MVIYTQFFWEFTLSVENQHITLPLKQIFLLTQ